MYALNHAIEIIEISKNIKKHLINLIINIENQQNANLNDLKNILLQEFFELKKIVTKNKEYYDYFFKKKINMFDKVIDDIFKDSIFHKSKFNKYIETQNSKEVINRLKYLNEDLINRILSTANHILLLYQNIDHGSAKKPLPQNEITEYEIYGPINKIILDLKYIFKKWVRNNNVNCRIWISGSCLDGVSPVKGLFFNHEFVAYKPIDYGKISDIDIGIGLDRITYGEDVPAHLQNKDKININNPFGQKILSLASESINKTRIRSDFGESKFKYIKLIEGVEHLKIKNIKLEDRGINLQFFLIDNYLPASKDLQRFQRKFILIDNFIQPDVKKEEQNEKDLVLSVINNHLGKLSNKQNMLILRLIMNSNFEKSNLKNIANEFSKEFSIANKKSNKIVRDIYSSVFKKSF
jgi:hypothetical protein